MDGIETSADVTDTDNVEAAGALMDSEVTDLEGIKGVTISTLQVNLTEGAFVDGDKTKLDGIETSADVTDATTVAAAGAVMNTGDEEIAGVKTFSSTILGSVNGSSGTCTGNAATVTNGVYTNNKISALAATTSSELASVISDETGNGSLVFATSPTLVTPLLGTPTSGVLTNCTGTASGLTAGTCSGNAGTASGLNMLPISTNTNLVSGKTYINTGSSRTHTLPTPSAANEIITIYSLIGFTLDKGSGTPATIVANRKTLCISTGASAGDWSCMTFEGTAVTF